jgi:retinoblastoma-like protein 1
LDSEYSRSKRTGSLALFFRKVYTLAHMRLNHLCHGLGIGEETFKRKIWTLFEHVLKSYTDLMKDRHLDQILMCSMYIVWKLQKINKEENIFSKIINQYKKQPQAEKHVYENVLIPEEIMKAAKSEEKPNLITFYNCVFVKVLEKYVKSFNSDQPPLSPLPRLKTHPQSPIRKVSDSHPVFIRPLKFAANDEVRYNPHSPHRPLSYSFSRSPAKVKIILFFNIENDLIVPRQCQLTEF